MFHQGVHVHLLPAQPGAEHHVGLGGAQVLIDETGLHRLETGPAQVLCQDREQGRDQGSLFGLALQRAPEEVVMRMRHRRPRPARWIRSGRVVRRMLGHEADRRSQV